MDLHERMARTMQMNLNRTLLIFYFNFNKSAIAAFLSAFIVIYICDKTPISSQNPSSVKPDSIMYMTIRRKYSKKLKKFEKIY